MRASEYGELPKAVYYQCSWVVKDVDRLSRLCAIRLHKNDENEVVFYEDFDSSSLREDVVREAKWKVSKIKEALEIVPEEYRVQTLESLAEGIDPGYMAHVNTWKKWRRVFIKELAHKLNLI